MTDDIYTHIINMPSKTKEAVTLNEDGTYSIFINANLTHENQLIAYEHAMRHIQNRDFEKKDVQEIEYTAHNPSVEKQTVRNEHICNRRKRNRIVNKKLQEREQRRIYLESIGARQTPDLISFLDNYTW